MLMEFDHAYLSAKPADGLAAWKKNLLADEPFTTGTSELGLSSNTALLAWSEFRTVYKKK